ncbi:MAG TPA: hypothetical protein DD490_22870 [Acidobacteria bacterium]|nr:hypothetical protein [Acidobacteriota bacterium]
MPTSVLSGFGHALRWMRDRHSRKQYQVAKAAGITKGMLSAYETGRQKPSLDTLGKLLETLGCDLHDLHNALQIVNGRPSLPRSSREAEIGRHPVAVEGPLTATNVRELLGLARPLGPDEEEALSRVVEAFHDLVAVWRRNALGSGGSVGL